MSPWRPGTHRGSAPSEPLPENRPPRGTAPQGGIVASANDLARYLQTMMNGRDDVLSAEGKSLMMRPAGAASPFYGLGWFVDSGNRTVWHSGTSPGYESLATMIPSEKKGVVVLVNGGSGVGLRGDGPAPQRHHRQGVGPRLRRRGVAPVAEGPVRLSGAPADRLPAQHDLGLAAPGRDTRQVGHLRPVQPVVPPAHHACRSMGHPALVPNLFGSPLANISLFQPDLGMALIATAVTGVLWAVFRLGVAYTNRSGPARRASPHGGDRT